jgi:tetratricopeptide (TPR) repeat protein
MLEGQSMPLLRHRRLLTALLIAGMSLACAAVASASERALPRELRPIVSAETGGASDVAKRFAAAIQAGDDAALVEVMHVEALIDRVERRLPMPADERPVFRAEMRKAVSRLASIMGSSAPSGMQVTYRGLYARRGRIHALLRLDLGEQGMNFFELELGRDAEGAVHVYDWYDYARGVEYTTNVRQLVGLASNDPSVIESELGASGLDAASAALVGRYLKEVRSWKLEESMATYDAMPPQLQHARPLMIQRVKAAALLDDEALRRRALAELDREHGSDPRLTLMLVDHYYYTGDREKLFGALDRMARYMGVRDPGVLNLQAGYEHLLGEYAAAEKSARKAIEVEPSYEPPHWLLVQSLLGQAKYDDVTRNLQLIGQRFGHDFTSESFADQPMYAEYAHSESFDAWLGGLPANR